MARPAPHPRKYEMMIVVAPTVTEDGLPNVVERVTGYLETHGGTIESFTYDSPWGRRRLAYPIQNFRDAFYVLYYFNIEPRAIDELDREIRLDDAIIRHLIVRYDPLTERMGDVHQRDEDEDESDADEAREEERRPRPARAATPGSASVPVPAAAAVEDDNDDDDDDGEEDDNGDVEADDVEADDVEADDAEAGDAEADDDGDDNGDDDDDEVEEDDGDKGEDEDDEDA